MVGDIGSLRIEDRAIDTMRHDMNLLLLDRQVAGDVVLGKVRNGHNRKAGALSHQPTHPANSTVCDVQVPFGPTTIMCFSLRWVEAPNPMKCHNKRESGGGLRRRPTKQTGLPDDLRARWHLAVVAMFQVETQVGQSGCHTVEVSLNTCWTSPGQLDCHSERLLGH